MYNRDKIIKTLQEIYDESKSITPYVVVAQPRRNKKETAAQNLNGYEGLHIDVLGLSHGFVDIEGEKVDVARNYLIERAIETDAKYLLFVGEDTVLPYDGFKILHETAEKNPNDVVVGVYYMKCSGPMIMTRDEHNWVTIPNVDPGQLIEAWQTGMDAMLIPIHILKKMKEQEPDLPFCCIGTNVTGEQGPIPFIGEDNFFVYRLRKFGSRLLVNTDVQCLHMDLATGMYTAHPSVQLNKYYTNIKPTRPLTLDDKEFIDKRWFDRLPEGTGAKSEKKYRNVIDQMIKDGNPIKINMGSGPDYKQGYINVDGAHPSADVKEDAFKFILEDNSVDEMHASHFIEHVPQHRAPEILSIWHKMLKEGGRLIMEQPDLEQMCKDFVNQSEEERHVTTTCIYGDVYGYFLHHGIKPENDSAEAREKGTLSPHLWGYTPRSLSKLVESIGFRDVKVMAPLGKHPGSNFRLECIK